MNNDQSIQYVGVHAKGFVWGFSDKEEAFFAAKEDAEKYDMTQGLLYQVPIAPHTKPTMEAYLFPMVAGCEVLKRLDFREGVEQVHGFVQRGESPDPSEVIHKKPATPAVDETDDEPANDDEAPATQQRDPEAWKADRDAIADELIQEESGEGEDDPIAEAYEELSAKEEAPIAEEPAEEKVEPELDENLVPTPEPAKKSSALGGLF